MARTARPLVPVLVGGMLISGVCNSLLSKYQDLQCVENCDDPDPRHRKDYEQPVWQTVNMFVGECLCLLVILLHKFLIRLRERSPSHQRPAKGPYLPIPAAPAHDSGVALGEEEEHASVRSGSRALSSLASSQHGNGSELSHNPWADDHGSHHRVHVHGAHGHADAVVAPPPEIAGRATRPGEISPEGTLYDVYDASGADSGRGSLDNASVVGVFNGRQGHRRPGNAYTDPSPASYSRSDGVGTVLEDDEEKGEHMHGWEVGLFWLPAVCDICGTTLMNVGLILTPVSIYQMTRGALVLWVGLFSVLFLRRHLKLHQWVALVTVMSGVAVVGLSGVLFAKEASASQDVPLVDGDGVHGEAEVEIGEDLPEAIRVLIGVLLILFAQIFTASQFVLEEKIMSRYSVEPLLAVGYEGVFGLLTTLAAMPFLHYAIGTTEKGKGGYFDVPAGWRQITGSKPILYSSVAVATSIALFNFFGLSVTRSVSATARSTIDTCRTLGVWLVSLLLGWEILRLSSGTLQIMGFAMVVYGTFAFNGVVRPPWWCGWRDAGEEEHEVVSGGVSRAESDETTSLLSAQPNQERQGGR